MSASSSGCWPPNFGGRQRKRGANEASVLRRACGSGRCQSAPGNRNLAESISDGLRDRNLDAGVYISVPENRPARSRNTDSALCSRPLVPGAQISQDVYVGVSELGNLSRERREPRSP